MPGRENRGRHTGHSQENKESSESLYLVVSYLIPFQMSFLISSLRPSNYDNTLKKEKVLVIITIISFFFKIFQSDRR
jgi:hypothetical protein